MNARRTLRIKDATSHYAEYTMELLHANSYVTNESNTKPWSKPIMSEPQHVIDITSFSAGLATDSTPPAKPTGFSYSSVAGREGFSLLTFSWDRNVESDLASYKLFAGDSRDPSSYQEVYSGNKNSTSFEISKTDYKQFYVKAYDTSLNASKASDTLGYDSSGLLPTKQRPDIFRFYDEKTGSHFYTQSAEERDSILSHLPNYKYEGNAFDGKDDFHPLRDRYVEVWRFYNKDTNTHFYTASAEERDQIQKNLPQYVFEGKAYDAYGNNERYDVHPLFRFYNTQTGTHFYTVDESEKINIETTIPQFKYEGIAYYVNYA